MTKKGAESLTDVFQKYLSGKGKVKEKDLIKRAKSYSENDINNAVIQAYENKMKHPPTPEELQKFPSPFFQKAAEYLANKSDSDTKSTQSDSDFTPDPWEDWSHDEEDSIPEEEKIDTYVNRYADLMAKHDELLNILKQKQQSVPRRGSVNHAFGYYMKMHELKEEYGNTDSVNFKKIDRILTDIKELQDEYSEIASKMEVRSGSALRDQMAARSRSAPLLAKKQEEKNESIQGNTQQEELKNPPHKKNKPSS